MASTPTTKITAIVEKNSRKLSGVEMSNNKITNREGVIALNRKTGGQYYIKNSLVSSIEPKRIYSILFLEKGNLERPLVMEDLYEKLLHK